MTIEVVPATAADMPELVRLNLQAQALHVRLHPDIFRDGDDHKALDAFWQGRLDDDAMTVAVARRNGQILGSIAFELQEREAGAYHHARRRLYIHHIVVAEDHRRTGAGGAMLAFCESEANRLDVTTVALDCWAGNDAAQEFFAQHGYGALNLVRSKSLD